MLGVLLLGCSRSRIIINRTVRRKSRCARKIGVFNRLRFGRNDSEKLRSKALMAGHDSTMSMICITQSPNRAALLGGEPLSAVECTIEITMCEHQWFTITVDICALGFRILK